MTLLSRLLGRGETKAARTTVGGPLRIHQPIIGFLNLLGPTGEALLAADRGALSPYFPHSVASNGAVPRAHVLFIYCDMAAGGRILGDGAGGGALFDLIKAAGAYVAVVATANPGGSYKDAIPANKDWSANIVFTIDRRGDRFSRFFQRLFAAMFNGTSMLTAWVQIAPQAEGPWMEEIPSTFMVPGAGHIVFDSRPAAAG